MFGEIMTLVVIAYTVYIYVLLLSRKEIKYTRYDQPFTVIIPCYNEDYVYLTKCVKSIIDANGDKQIILVNNNSNKEETLLAIQDLNKQYPQIEVYKELRQGKRFAHACGLGHAKNELIVFVDSDTIVNKNALLELIKPMRDENVGAVAGQVKLANKTENIFTRCISAMFWTSFNITRKATCAAGYTQVIAGALGCYRKSDLLKLEDEYVNQTFLGRPCSISDDRFLTMRIQTRFGKRIEYQERAKCYTFMPPNPFKFWKTLERWRRGATREILLLWKEPKSKAKFMFFDTQFNFVILTLMSFGKIYFIINFFLYLSWYNFFMMMTYFFLFSFMFSTYMFVYNIKETPYKIMYLFMYEFFFIFVYFHAWFNIRKQGKWSTR